MEGRQKPIGISIHIGLNSVDRRHYGSREELKTSEDDAREMWKLARSRGFQTSLLLTKKATTRTVKSRIRKAAEILRRGDLLFVTYSGHGAQVRDKNGEEVDGWDETWELFDRDLVDDRLFDLLRRFKAGVRVLVLSDSCHSGTVIDNKGRGRVTASVILISASKDKQEASSGTPNALNSLFTDTLLKVWDSGKFRGDYPQFRRRIVELMRRRRASQRPAYVKVGRPDPRFEHQVPFTI